MQNKEPPRNTISVGVLTLQRMKTEEKLLLSTMNAWKINLSGWMFPGHTGPSVRLRALTACFKMECEPVTY